MATPTHPDWATVGAKVSILSRLSRTPSVIEAEVAKLTATQIVVSTHRGEVRFRSTGSDHWTEVGGSTYDKATLHSPDDERLILPAARQRRDNALNALSSAVHSVTRESHDFRGSVIEAELTTQLVELARELDAANDAYRIARESNMR